MTEEEKRARGRPPDSRKVSLPGEPYGGKRLELRLEPSLYEWTTAPVRGGTKELRRLAERERKMPPATFPAPLEVTEALSLWWTPGAPAEVQVNQLAQEVTPLEARAMAGWLLAYADEAEKEKADG